MGAVASIVSPLIGAGTMAIELAPAVGFWNAYKSFIMVSLMLFSSLLPRNEGGFGQDEFGMDQWSSMYPKMVVGLDHDDNHNGLVGKEIELKWWDRKTGDAEACWKDSPDNCGELYQLFLSCYDWSDTGVPDSIPKLPYADEPFTPNGSMTITLPDGTGPVDAKWAAPIAGDCKYWDKNWTFPLENAQWSDDANLEKAFCEEKWMPPKLAVPDLAPDPRYGEGGYTLIDENGEPLTEEARLRLAQFPRKRSAQDLEAYTKRAASLVYDHLRSSTSDGTHNAIQHAMTAILEAHEEHTGTVWKRLTRPALEPAHIVVDKLVDSIIAQTHPGNRRRMETFAISGAFGAVAARAEQGRMTAQDGQLILSMWNRIFR